MSAGRRKGKGVRPLQQEGQLDQLDDEQGRQETQGASSQWREDVRYSQPDTSTQWREDARYSQPDTSTQWREDARYSQPDTSTQWREDVRYSQPDTSTQWREDVRYSQPDASPEWREDVRYSQPYEEGQQGQWSKEDDRRDWREDANEEWDNERENEQWEIQDTYTSLDGPPPTREDGTTRVSDGASTESPSEISQVTQDPVPKANEPLYSPLAGIIRRGSIGGTGERGQNHSMVPPTIDENGPYVGKLGGGKIPVVGLIRRGSISGIGERGFAESQLGSRENEQKKEMEKDSLGMHDPRLKKKEKKPEQHMKRKGPPEVRNVPGDEVLGAGKAHSQVGSVAAPDETVEEKKSAIKAGIEMVNVTRAGGGAPRRDSESKRQSTARRQSSSKRRSSTTRQKRRVSAKR